MTDENGSASAQELTRQPSANAPSWGQASRLDIAPEQRRAIRETVAKDCTDTEFVMFLEMAAHLGLNPFAKEIWAAKLGNRDGGRGQVAIMVGRDGYLSKADRNPDFRGMDADVVRENDEFKVSRTEGNIVVDHGYEGSPEKRGKIVGAWALVHREGRKPTYFFAPLEQYRPTSEAKLKYSPWGSQEDVMILKCAQSTALRLAFVITGTVGAEEVQAVEDGAEEIPDEELWGTDEALIERLRHGFEAVNERQPGAWRLAKIRATLAGMDDEQRSALADELSAAVDAFDAEAEEPVAEAEVVS